jgi:hypothetical protein
VNGLTPSQFAIEGPAILLSLDNFSITVMHSSNNQLKMIGLDIAESDQTQRLILLAFFFFFLV